jgi:hypothetical protein
LHAVEAANVDEGEVKVVISEPLELNTVDEVVGEVVIGEPLKSNTVIKPRALGP